MFHLPWMFNSSFLIFKSSFFLSFHSMSCPFCLSQFCCWTYFNIFQSTILGFNSLKLICLIDIYIYISTINVFYYNYILLYIHRIYIYIYSSPFWIPTPRFFGPCVRRTAGDASQLGVVAEEFVYAARMLLLCHPGQPLGCVWKCRVPLNPMVLLIIIPIQWLFHWEYILFSDKPTWGIYGDWDCWDVLGTT